VCVHVFVFADLAVHGRSVLCRRPPSHGVPARAEVRSRPYRPGAVPGFFPTRLAASRSHAMLRCMGLSAALLCPLVATSARAGIVLTIDEFGHSSLNGDFNSLAAGKAIDPFDPNNGLRPLVYSPTTFVPLLGDITMTEEGTSNAVSDLVRFTRDAN